MEIDHDPNDGKKFPNYGDKQYHQDKLGRSPTPADAWSWFGPILIFAVSMYLWRYGWPF